MRDFGLPLQVFNSACAFVPLLTLHEVGLFDECKGFLAGTTNPLFLNFPKARADVVVNLDLERVELQEKSPVARAAKHHTAAEKKLVTGLLRRLGEGTPQVRQERLDKGSLMLKQDETETTGFMQVSEEEQHLVRHEFERYLTGACVQMALCKKLCDEFASRFPAKARADSEESGDEDKEIIVLERAERQDAEEEEKKELSKVQRLTEKLQKMQVGKGIDEKKLKKMNALRKKTARQVLEHNNMFSLKFLLAWTETLNFQVWLRTHSKGVSALSPQAGFVGSAVIHYKNGDCYQGNMVNGQREGVGRYVECGTGLTYNGEWRGDERHGQGTLSSEDQDFVYDGEWQRGLKHGKGQLIRKGEKYSGGFCRDKFHKFGVLVEQDGSVYEGDWALGRKEGMGQYRRANGDVYIGEFAADRFHGKGQLKYAGSLEIYNGDFVGGLRHGHGQYYSADQRELYDGPWVNDKRSGAGLLVIQGPDSVREVQGFWANDQFQFDQQARVVTKDAQGTVLSSFEGKVDRDFTPVIG